MALFNIDLTRTAAALERIADALERMAPQVITGEIQIKTPGEIFTGLGEEAQWEKEQLMEKDGIQQLPDYQKVEL